MAAGFAAEDRRQRRFIETSAEIPALRSFPGEIEGLVSSIGQKGVASRTNVSM